MHVISETLQKAVSGVRSGSIYVEEQTFRECIAHEAHSESSSGVWGGRTSRLAYALRFLFFSLYSCGLKTDVSKVVEIFW